MSLIVEDGTAKADADSYCSIAFADAYLAGLGFTDWADLDPTDSKEPALRRATQYMKQHYRRMWAGTRATTVQSLDWPRASVPDSDGPGWYADGSETYLPPDYVPSEVQQACATLAMKSASGIDLAPDLGAPVIEETVGPITTKYANGARQTVRFQDVDGLLSPFLATNTSTFAIRRS